NSIRPQDGVREAADIPCELTGLKLVVSEGGSQQQDPADAIIYDFVPDGKTYTAGSTNVVNVQPGDQVKVNLTVKNDAGTAGAEMYFTFDSKLTLGRTAKGTAYDGTFQWSASDGALVWTCKDGHNQTAADGSVIYSFNVTIPANAADGDSFLIDVNPSRKSDISIRPQGGVNEAPDHKYAIHGLKLVVGDDDTTVTSTSVLGS
ncbi:MAG: hypothetical protein J6Y19_02450, partial [Kiritimatiellae bacterium]|nr:hypothetical protein [Kiritimatiellia bacterium]